MVDKKQILVEVSHHHIHLSRKDIDSLFGADYQLKVLRDLSQSGEFAAKETVTLINGNQKIEKVRIIGPERKQTQIELSRTDANILKMNLPLRESGNVKNTPGIEIQGPQEKIKLNQGVILAQRHLHASEEDAKKLNLKNGDLVDIKIPGKRSLVFSQVIVRINPHYNTAVHLDRDEGNAAGIDKEVYGELIN